MRDASRTAVSAIEHPQINSEWARLPLFDREGWKRLAFGAFAESVNERVEPAKAADEIYVGLDDLDSGDLHIRRWGKGSDVIGTKLRFRKGDIIFGRRRAYQRKLAVAEFDGICSAHAMVVRAKPKIILSDFLPFLMASDRFMRRAVEISVGSLSPTINWTTLKLEEFELPPLGQQRRLSEMFWALDSVKTKNLVSADVAQTLIESELDEFLYRRKKWPVAVSRDLLLEGPRNGYSPPANESGIGRPTLRISAIRRGKVVSEGSIKYAEVRPEDVAQFTLRRDDILVVRGNGNRMLCGRAGIVKEFPDQCFYPDLLIRLRFRPNALLPEFAVMQWNESKTHLRLLKKAKSTNGISKINGQDIQSHELVVPPIEEQKKFLREMEPKTSINEALGRLVDDVSNVQRSFVQTMLG